MKNSFILFLLLLGLSPTLEAQNFSDFIGYLNALPSAERQVKVDSFMDELDFTVSRIRKCCTHYALPDGRLIPGCAYNTVHRYRDERLALNDVEPGQRIPLE